MKFEDMCDDCAPPSISMVACCPCSSPSTIMHCFATFNGFRTLHVLALTPLNDITASAKRFSLLGGTACFLAAAPTLVDNDCIGIGWSVIAVSTTDPTSLAVDVALGPIAGSYVYIVYLEG